jgi:subtilase family serine protease
VSGRKRGKVVEQLSPEATHDKPGYQDGVVGTSAGRGVPDVAADASPISGLAQVLLADGQEVVANTAGTSAAAPFWAGIIALADQYAGRNLGWVNPVIYRIARGAQYHKAFHDVTNGDSTMLLPRLVAGYGAAPGWDAVTGWGSPDAEVLVPLLAEDDAGAH